MPTKKMHFRTFATALSSFFLVSTAALTASASPVLLVGTGTEKVHSTHVSVLQGADTTVVTILPDYQGPLSSFAVVIPVPSDVSAARLATLKREFVDRLETITAPRFAEFWEMDPCEPGQPEQEWERSVKADPSSGFLGTVQVDTSKQTARELLLDVDSQTKEGEYQFRVFPSAEALTQYISSQDWTVPGEGEAAIREYASQGYHFVVATVDVNRIELIGGDRALLSPIRFWTKSEFKKLPARFGLSSAAPHQELFLYTLVKDQRMQVTNYPTKAAPTNLTVDFAVKERMGEFYTALHDRFLEKNPGTFLLEYAFSTADCGKPCPNEPLLPHELMSLGGDVLDAQLPASERRPRPADPTEEEEAKLQALLDGRTPQEKAQIQKDWQAEREELAVRRALLARHEYILSRLHYRYDKSQLPQDPEWGPGASVQGGVALPEGTEGQADTAVGVSETNQYQTRFNHLHPSISQVECENPVRSRWGKAPSTYRGLRKIWVAEDLARKNRKQIQLEEVVKTTISDLGIAAKAPEPEVTEQPTEEKKSENCGCHVAGLPLASTGWWSLSALLGWAAFLRRKTR